MRRLVLLVVALFLLSAAPASAGGPTSAIITSPTEKRVGALYVSDLNYSELQAALGANEPAPDPQAPLLHGTPGSNTVNITWLIHDVQVWRVDHVFLTADGGPWVETYQSYEGVKFDQRGVVHRPANAEKLVQVINEILGPPGQSIRHPARTVAVPTPAPEPPATGIQWTSLLIGVIGGAVLVAFGRIIFSAFRRRTPVNPMG